jgi:glycine cleavage system H protein
MGVVAGLLYTKHDEWIKIEGDTVIIGITAHAAESLGDLVHIELPEEGDTFDTGDAIVEVESVKAVAEIYTPWTCEVIAVNADLDGEEERVNEDPFGAGWLVKVRVSGSPDTSGLLDADGYQAKLDEA